MAHEETGNLESAIESAAKAVALDNSNPDYTNFLSYLYADSNRELDSALKLVQTALKKDPYNGAYLDTLGWIYYRQGRYRESLTKLLQAERNLFIRNETDAVVLEHIGDVYSKLGERSKAVAWWRKALDKGAEKSILEKINRQD